MKMLAALLASVSFVSIGSTEPYLEVCEEGQVTCFTHHYSGDSYSVAWGAVFYHQVFHDPVDNTLSPWSIFRSGQVTAVDGVLRKTVNNDANGAVAQFTEPTDDFQITLYARKVNEDGGNAVRYSITDIDGNGYGFFMDSGTDDLTIETRTNWLSGELGTSEALPGEMQINHWYTMRFQKHGKQLYAEVYDGRVNIDADEPEPILSVEAEDETYGTFTQIGINGGHDFDTDEVKVLSTRGVEYEVRIIHDDGTVEEMGRTSETSMTVQTTRSSSQVFQARAVSGDAVSGWGGLDNPETTWDGHAWVIVIKPKPPEPAFGDGQ